MGLAPLEVIDGATVTETNPEADLLSTTDGLGTEPRLVSETEVGATPVSDSVTGAGEVVSRVGSGVGSVLEIGGTDVELGGSVASDEVSGSSAVEEEVGVGGSELEAPPGGGKVISVPVCAQSSLRVF